MASKNPKFGLSFDWETSGSDWSSVFAVKHQGISLGMVVFEMATFLPVDELYLEIQFDESKYEWNAEAEAIHGLSREHLAKYGVTPEEAAIQVASMILKWFGTTQVTVLGHNIDFDIAFMKQLLEPFEVMFKIHLRKIETSSLSLVCFGSSHSNDLFEMTGLATRSHHNALEDAKMTLEAVRRIRAVIHETLYG